MMDIHKKGKERYGAQKYITYLKKKAILQALNV